MLIPVFGTPSLLTSYVQTTVRAIVEAVSGGFQSIPAGTLDEFGAAIKSPTHEWVVVSGEIPSAGVADIIASARVPYLVCIQSPAEIVLSLGADRALSGLPALRYASQSLATLHDLALSQNCLLLTSVHLQLPAEQLVAGILRHYNLSIDAATLPRIVKMADEERMKAQVGMGKPDPDGEDRILADRNIGGYRSLLERRAVEGFDWEPEVFLGARPHGEPLEGPISLIGGRRCFAFGPYFHLPRGRWTAVVDFRVDENISGNALKIDVFTDKEISVATTRLPISGRYRCQIGFQIVEPRLPLQIRLFNEEGAIEGWFELLGVAVGRAKASAA